MKGIAGVVTVASILCFHFGIDGWGLGLAIAAAVLWLIDIHIEVRENV